MGHIYRDTFDQMIESAVNLKVQFQREENGTWIVYIPSCYAMGCATTAREALQLALSTALRDLAIQLEKGLAQPGDVLLSLDDRSDIVI